MVFTKEGLIRLLITIVISIFICFFVWLVFSADFLSLDMILKSVLLGSIIWLTAEISMEIVGRIWPHNIIPSYILLCSIIILGTTMGLLFFEIDNLGVIILADFIAVTSGLAIAILNRRKYMKKLNRQLAEFKDN
ncbi:MAG: hypothetical protein AB1Z23_06760 [Eubacteriales bacterium]